MPLSLGYTPASSWVAQPVNPLALCNPTSIVATLPTLSSAGWVTTPLDRDYWRPEATGLVVNANAYAALLTATEKRLDRLSSTLVAVPVFGGIDATVLDPWTKLLLAVPLKSLEPEVMSEPAVLAITKEWIQLAVAARLRLLLQWRALVAIWRAAGRLIRSLLAVIWRVLTSLATERLSRHPNCSSTRQRFRQLQWMKPPRALAHKSFQIPLSAPRCWHVIGSPCG